MTANLSKNPRPILPVDDKDARRNLSSPNPAMAEMLSTACHFEMPLDELLLLLRLQVVKPLPQIGHR